MMAIDRGGQCHGIIFRLPADQVRESFDKLFRREMVVKPSSNVPRWVTARTVDGPVRTIAFVVNRQSPHYSGKLTLKEVADVVSKAAGHWGSCAEICTIPSRTWNKRYPRP